MVAGIPNFRISLDELVIDPASATTLEILSNTTSRTGAMPIAPPLFGIAKAFDAQGSPIGHIMTETGDPLVFNLGGNVVCTGWFSYHLVWGAL